MQECNVRIDHDADDSAESPTLAASVQAPTATIASPAGSADGATYLKGASLALFAITIWASWFISTRFQATTGLGPYDIVAVRYGFTAILLLPLTWRWRKRFAEIGLADLLVIFAGSGIVYGVTITAAVALAPAAQTAALTPGVMPMWAALLSVIFLGDKLSRGRKLGFVFTFAGVIAIAGTGVLTIGGLESLGHLMSVLAAFLFASYTIALRRSKLTGLEAAAFVSIVSSIVFLPVYFAFLQPKIWTAPSSSLAMTIVFQSILANIVSLIAFGRAALIIGPAKAAAFAALVPAMTLLLAIPFLGEYPTLTDSLAIVAITIGVYLTSGAPLPEKGAFRRLARP